MIEFIETHYSDNTATARLACDALPQRNHVGDYRYTIRVRADGRCECKSRANGAGSTRYYTFRTYSEAMNHARKWALRQIKRAA